MLLVDCIISLLIPILFICLGTIFWKHPPKKRNSMVGWRTSASMKNQQTWDYANTLSGKYFFNLGLWELLGTFIVFILVWRINKNFNDTMTVVYVTIQSLLLIPLYIKVEAKIKQKFHNVFK